MTKKMITSTIVVSTVVAAWLALVVIRNRDY